MKIEPNVSFHSPDAAPKNVGSSNGFQEMMMNAINGAEHAQITADTQVERLARGEGNLHEVALSLEQADISMRLLVKARNKIVEAYQEIMRMPV
jgi:flagellar hook-basal body complex protein FliE